MDETTEGAPDAPVTIELELPHGLHARYRGLVESGLYADLGEAVREALRTHIRAVVDASHHTVTLDVRDGAAPAPDSERPTGD